MGLWARKKCRLGIKMSGVLVCEEEGLKSLWHQHVTYMVSLVKGIKKQKCRFILFILEMNA